MTHSTFDNAVVVAAPEHGAALAALFERTGVACHCRYWHFPGNANAWLDRSANAPEQSRAEMLAALGARSPEMTGLLALDGERAVGWMKIAPAFAMTKLYEQRLYRHLPCFDGPRDGVFVIGCVLVDPEFRRRGVARALLAGAIDEAKRGSYRALEAFPRRAEGTRDADVWTGPPSIFAEAGFVVVHDFAPYPVLRLSFQK